MSEDRWLFLNAVRPGYDKRRPETDLEQEQADDPRRPLRRRNG